MEISNKAFGIFCVAVVAVTVYVRAQSLQQKPAQPTIAAEAPKAETVVRTTKKRHGIPDSALPPDPLGTPSDEVAVADTSAPVDELPADQTTAPAANAAPADTKATDDNAADDDDLTQTDDLGQMENPAPPTNDAVQLSDRDMLRILLTSMPEEQRESFRLMWFTMSPDDRQDFLDQLRQSQQSG